MSAKRIKITCINCGMCLSRQKKHAVLKQNTNVITLIANWISPEVITENDSICTDCWKKALEVVNSSLALKIIKTEMPEGMADIVENGATDMLQSNKAVGHQLVCVTCGRSVLRRSHKSVLGSNPEQLKVISELVPGKTITENHRICNACWQRVIRIITKQKKNEAESSVQSKIDIEITLETQEETKPLQIKPNRQEAEEFSESSDKEWEPPKNYNTKQSTTPTQINNTNNNNYMELPNYRRAADSKSRCVFKPCKSHSYVPIPDYLRRKLLFDHKYYIPKRSRICEKHFNESKWDELVKNNSMSTFTAEHIEHVFTLLNTDSNIDFNDYMNIEENVFKYLLGMTKDNFTNIINDIPDLKCMNKGEIGLAGLILKYKNNDSGTKLAEFMRMSRRTLEKQIKSVRKAVMSRMAELEKEDQIIPAEQSEPIMFTPQEVTDYFESLSKDEPRKKKQVEVTKKVTVYCDAEKSNNDESDLEGDVSEN